MQQRSLFAYKQEENATCTLLQNNTKTHTSKYNSKAHLCSYFGYNVVLATEIVDVQVVCSHLVLKILLCWVADHFGQKESPASFYFDIYS